MDRLNEDTKREVTARLNKLTVILVAAGRTDDLVKAAQDPEYQEQLLDELVPEKNG